MRSSDADRRCFDWRRTVSAGRRLAACRGAPDGFRVIPNSSMTNVAARRDARLKIPFNRPVIAGRELEHIGEAIALGQLAGDGAFTDRCQRWLEAEVGCGTSLLTHSC